MNKGVVTIGSALGAGVVSKGLAGVALANASNPIKIAVSLALCFGAGYMATKETKSNALQGAYIGTSIAQGLDAIKHIASSPAIAERLNPDTKVGQFSQKALGLNGAVNGLNGSFDEAGNYHLEDGTGRYITPSGQTVGGLNAAYYGREHDVEEEELAGYYDEDGNFIEDDGELNGFDDEPEYPELNAGWEDEEEDELNAGWEDEEEEYN